MTQEQKDLQLRDLCARLPYGVYVLVHDTFEYSTVPFEKVYLKSSDISSLIDSISLNERYNSKDKRFNRIIKERKDFLEFKPFLIPLSKMTDVQREELYKIGWYLDGDKIYSCFRNYDEENYKTHIDCFELINWCYKNNFDINGLIPMGLAIDATDNNIYNH